MLSFGLGPKEKNTLRSALDQTCLHSADYRSLSAMLDQEFLTSDQIQQFLPYLGVLVEEHNKRHEAFLTALLAFTQYAENFT